MSAINSPVLGPTRHATDEECAQIEALLSRCALTVFQLMNKHINARGYCLQFTALDPLEQPRTMEQP